MLRFFGQSIWLTLIPLLLGLLIGWLINRSRYRKFDRTVEDTRTETVPANRGIVLAALSKDAELGDDLRLLAGMTKPASVVLKDQGQTFRTLRAAQPRDLRATLERAGVSAAGIESWPLQAAYLDDKDATGFAALLGTLATSNDRSTLSGGEKP